MVILVRYGEIFLKGLNRPYFEKLLLQSIQTKLRSFQGVSVERGDGRYYVRGFAEEEAGAVMEALTKVFGVHSISPAVETEKEIDAVFSAAESEVRQYLAKYGLNAATFKVETKRSDKRFPMGSYEISREAGAYLLEHVPGLTVDVHQPQFQVHIEIREKAYVYVDVIPGQGGMPLGSNGKAMLLLSGGIDSPVAGYMIAKRGVTLDAVHYHSFPYTSERAKEKVLELAKLMTEYTGPIRLNIVSFTEIQMEIYEKCPEEQLTILMRRFMMKIAERLAKKAKAKALVTGESIGQVASQTIESLHVTNSAVEMPVFRPLIGMDKIEIMERAKQIHTYDTSILPYEDCCTVFVPKHPVTKPDLEKIVASEQLLDGDALIQRALDTVETVLIK